MGMKRVRHNWATDTSITKERKIHRKGNFVQGKMESGEWKRHPNAHSVAPEPLRLLFSPASSLWRGQWTEALLHKNQVQHKSSLVTSDLVTTYSQLNYTWALRSKPCNCVPLKSYSSVGKESTCNAGDPGSTPASGRSSGEGIGYPLQYFWASLVAQLVKNLPAVWESWVLSLGWEDLLEKGKPTHSSILAWRIPWTI